MRRIPSLNVDATTVFDEIAEAKRRPRRTRMVAVRARVLDAYQAYDGAAPEVGNMDPLTLTDLQKQAMRHAYNVETLPMAGLRGRLLGRVVAAKCPFCGISESATLDHYLPKESYPEFSIFPGNLIPCCGTCNTRKQDRILEQGTDVRIFLHPYFDVIPDASFLMVRARMQEDALVLAFRITRPEGMALRVFRHLKSHFTALGLADRYRIMSLEHLGDMYPALLRAYGVNEDAARVSTKLIESAEDSENVRGTNFWVAKLYRALAGDREFCRGGFEAIRIQL